MGSVTSGAIGGLVFAVLEWTGPGKIPRNKSERHLFEATSAAGCCRNKGDRRMVMDTMAGSEVK